MKRNRLSRKETGRLKMQNGLMNRPLSGAAEEIRTPTPVTALPPQSSASTNFATAAFFEVGAKIGVCNKTF